MRLPGFLPALLLLVSALPIEARHLGLDVSHHSGEVAWEDVVASGEVAFVYLKATEGVDAADPTFEEHWRQLAALGVPRGAYHFYVTEDDPEEQARFFLSRYRPSPGDLVPVVDVEVLGHGTEGDLRPKLRRFLELVEAEVGAAPMIYTSPNFWKAHFDDSFSRHPLWIAEYGVDTPVVPDGWERWTLWQYRGDAPFVGVEKATDLSSLHPELVLDHLRIGPPPASHGP